MNTKRKTIMVSEATWKALAKMGDLQSSFDSVILSLLNPKTEWGKNMSRRDKQNETGT